MHFTLSRLFWASFSHLRTQDICSGVTSTFKLLDEVVATG